MPYTNCTLCPRECAVDRSAGQTGFCGCPATAVVSKAMLHQWEEPVLAGSGGSGAIFFGGCTLGCRYCQNYEISRTPKGEAMDATALRKCMEDLIARGAENIDLVTPTQYLPTVLEALETPLGVPVVYNCGGYERPETIALLSGKVDIFLPDLKYADNALAKALSGAADYFQTAMAAIEKMVSITGAPVFEGERLKKGTVIRHLILPGQVENSLKVLDAIGERFGRSVLVSLMRQYTPIPGMEAPFDRPITNEEYDAVLSWMYLNDLGGFTQEGTASDRNFIPDFSSP